MSCLRSDAKAVSAALGTHRALVRKNDVHRCDTPKSTYTRGVLGFLYRTVRPIDCLIRMQDASTQVCSLC